jgi:hypothetical protein
MTNKAIRHHHAARLAARQPPSTHEYEILDPSHQPDLRGELAGGKVFHRSGKQFVRLSEAQAKFYEDSGSLQKVEHRRPAPSPDEPA